MKNSLTPRFCFINRPLFGALGVLALACFAPALQAKTGPEVAYSPDLQIVQGDEPLNSSYILQITSPSDLVGNATISFNITLDQAPPAGVSNSTALGFVSISPSTVTFTAPNQTVDVNVISDIPLGNWSGAYYYEITTVGWPSGLAYTDPAAFINVTVAPGTAIVVLPVVTITSPPNQATYTWTAGGPPLQIPYTIVASTPDGSPLLTLTDDLGGVSLTSIISGLLTGNATASGTLNITAPGTYTIDASATNLAGVASTSNQFTVLVNAGPPTVVINTPAANSAYVMTANTTLDVPFTFTGTSQYGGVEVLSATVDGTPVTVTPSGIGNLVATANGTMALTSGGSHELTVTCEDGYGTATSSELITVSVQAPSQPPTVVIDTPAANTTYSYTLGASPLSIPFTFTGSSTGDPVTTLTAQVNGSNTTFSTTGLNTQVANGTTTLSLSPNATGNYTYNLAVTASNDAGTAAATEDIFVNVVQPASTLNVTINKPAANSTYALSSNGSAVSIPDAFTAKSTNASGVTALAVTLNGTPVTVTPSAYGQPTVTANGTLSISVAGTYILAVTATDASGNVTTSENLTVTAPSPSPQVVITQPCDGSSFTIGTSSCPLYVPVTVTANTTPGSTLSALTASLNGSNITLSVTGLSTTSAKGTASVKITSTGTYTIVATTTAGGVSANSTISFRVEGSSSGSGYGSGSGSGWGSGYGSGFGGGYGGGSYNVSSTCLTAPPPCEVSWEQNWSCSKTQTGGSTLPLCFQIQYSNSCGTYWNNYFNNCGSDYYGCDSDYRQDWAYFGYFNTYGGNSQSASSCLNNKWNNISGTECSSDTSVKVCVYEVYSNGTCSSATTYTCGSNGTCSINSSDQYSCSFATGKGSHCYRADVYNYQSGADSPTFLGSCVFYTK